ncbi:MAG: archaeal proteasome endopeptidase complex subunit beta [Candidatus Jordarchaeales archaeon]|nr:archaeal proteasome endopeptidase complex subunit beta [Candidatus Jordarchaeia archaeon]
MQRENSKVFMSGTTTVGIVCKDGVVLATESQATMGNIIASTTAPKIFKVADRIAVTISGSVADCQHVVDVLKANLSLLKMELKRDVSVKAAARLTSLILFQNRLFPYISMLILGGVDSTGPHLFTLDPMGSLIEEDKFGATGSGSVIAFGVLEDEYKDGITVDEAASLAERAIRAARSRDTASGGPIQIFKITKNKIEETRIE